MTCPNCGRTVEAGFRFCDGCGTKLEVASPMSTAAPAPTEPASPRAPTPPERPPKAGSFFQRVRRLVVQDPEPDKPDAGPEDPPTELEAAQPATEPPREQPPSVEEPSTPGEERVPVAERWRRRRAERSALGKAERALSESPPALETAPEVTAPAPVERPAGATSRPKTAEELRGALPLIGGRLRWTEEEQPAPEEAPAPAIWRPVPIPEEPAAAKSVPWGRVVIQFFAALLAGAIGLLALAALASVASDGRVALLEIRGLPIFIGGAVSVVVFALLRTGERNREQTTRRGAIAGVVVGLVALVVLSAILYQPAIAGKLQPRIERALQVFGSEDAAALESFQDHIVEWNDSAQAYHDELEVALRNRENVDGLRGSAVQAETTLEGITSEMRSSAEEAQHPELRDTLGDLASIYAEQLGGLRVVNRGLLVDNIELVRTGDARFKEAHERAGTLFQERLRSLLDRGGFDANAFGRAIAG